MVSRDDRSEGPPRKRLLADTNPNLSVVIALPVSTVSSDSSSDWFAKNARELPNLCVCHGCGVRINYTNPKERLQPLDSMWRVVLLCEKCTKRVDSSELCPYCFAAVAEEEDCFKCSDCRHSIHKDCVERCGLVLGLSVCVDCWIPDAFANSTRARKWKFRRRNNECCEQVDALRESRVFMGECRKPNSFENEVERKVAAAAKAAENALRKAVAAKNAVELAKGVLSVVAGRKAAGGCEMKDVDDAELGFLLHRAINSSPKISRYACLGSSFRRDDASITCYSRRPAGKNVSTLDAPLICYSRKHGKGCFKNSVSLNAPLMCYSRRRSHSKACAHDRECESLVSETSEKLN